MDYNLPRKAQLKRAIKQLAASLPQNQYTYKGLMSGDQVKDVMKLKRARSGEQIQREHQYMVNHHNFVNHKRALNKILKRTGSETELQSQILSYIDKANKEHEEQQSLQAISKPSLWRRLVNYVTRLLLGIR